MFKSQNAKIFASITVVLLVIGLSIGAISLRSSSLQNQVIQQQANDQIFDLKVKIITSEDQETTYLIRANKEEALFSVLKRFDLNNDNFKMEYQEFEELGSFITNFNDIPLDQNSQFWELIVNGQQSQVGVSIYKVLEGDQVTYQVTNFN